MSEATHQHQKDHPGGWAATRLSGGQLLAVGASTLFGLALAAYGVAGSYETIFALADRKGVPLAEFVPAGIDGGLIGVILLDIVLTWIGQPLAWLRQLVRVLAAGTVAANAAAGWPDAVAVGLHVAAPLMLLAMVEAGRSVLLRRMAGAGGRVRDPVPLARWLLAPWPTWLLWRRTVLWQLSSYRSALHTEQEIRRAVTLLRARYGRRWKRAAPADLVWMLRSGVFTDDACSRVHALVAGATCRTLPCPDVPGPRCPRTIRTRRQTPRSEQTDMSAGIHFPTDSKALADTSQSRTTRDRPHGTSAPRT
jgi:hypothetical protein